MSGRDELAALMKDRLREVYMTATGEKYDAAFIMDDDPLNDVVVDGHVDFIDLADAILARWRLVPVEVPNPAYDAGPGAQCGECGHFACRHNGEACQFPRPPENPCDCRGFLWNDVRILKPHERTMQA